MCITIAISIQDSTWKFRREFEPLWDGTDQLLYYEVKIGSVRNLIWPKSRMRRRRRQRQRERQKSRLKISKTTTLHVHHAFLYISLPSQHDHGVKMPIFLIMEDVNTRYFEIFFSFSFWTWIWFLGIQLRESSPKFDKVSLLEPSRWRLNERELTF